MLNRAHRWFTSSESWPWIRHGLYWFVVSRLALVAITLMLPMFRAIYPYANLVTAWYRYDANHYAQIARFGYSSPYLANWLAMNSQRFDRGPSTRYS